MIRTVLLLTLLGIPQPAAGQSPTPDFVSPTKSAHGFVLLRYTATESAYRYYDIDANAIRIMNGPYSTTVAATIPLEANEESSAYALLAFADMSGDGFNDLVISKVNVTTPGGLYAFRVVNSITGQTIYRCEDSTYSCIFVQAADLNNDGLVELVAKRTARSSLPTGPSQYYVFPTSGVVYGR